MAEVILPGSLFNATYPEFFPCPTWEYGQTITGHEQRTPFECGWTRQRKRWPEANSTVNLSFTMPTDMFDNWSRWMVNNGYKWFAIPLDRFSGEQAVYEVRLISKIQFRYRTFDTVVVNVLGELGAPLNANTPADTTTPLGDGPLKDVLPQYGPDEPDGPVEPECQSYDCSAFMDQAQELGMQMTTFQDFMYGTLPATLPGTNLEVAGDWVNQIGGAMPGAGPFESYWTIAASDIDQCPGHTQGLYINPAGFPNGFDQQSFKAEGSNSIVMVHKGPLEAGWDTLDAVLSLQVKYYKTDLNGTSTVYELGGARYNSEHGGGTSYPNAFSFMSSEYYYGARITPAITWNSGINITTVAVTMGGLTIVDRRWFPDGSYKGESREWWTDCTVKVSVNGSTWSETFTLKVLEVAIENGIGTPQPVGLSTTLTKASQTGLVLNKVGAYLFALGTFSDITDEQIESLYLALQRNYASYTPPAWCPGPRP